MSGYCDAIEAAGAEVLAFGEFGSYQGDWYAKVKWEGQTVLVGGAYGSCSGCDAFEAEFMSTLHPTPEALAAFGRTYLADPLDSAKARADAVEQAEWDVDSRDIIKWFDEHFPVAT